MFRVLWEHRALDELLRLWMHEDVAGRAALTAAAHRLDLQLEANAIEVGESRTNPFRLVIERPLVATFAVDQRRKIAYVLQVWECSRRKN
jgi:hypothetical protein